MTKSPLTTRPIGMKQVPPGSLIPNPHNPRVLFDRQPMDVLTKSIRKSGILVPLTVYKESRSGKYVILDGQRRWLCACKLELKTVPINEVPEPSLVQNIVTMFHIHKLREDWELMPTALKIELLIKETGDRKDESLAEMTGLDVAVIVRCKKLIYYSREFQDMMLRADPEKRMKADFFIELYAVIRDRDVIAFSWFKENQFIRQMLIKYLEPPKTIRSVTDFRLIKQHLTNARRAVAVEKFGTRLRQFAENPAMPLEALEIEEISAHSSVKVLLKKVDGLKAAIDSIDVEEYFGEEKLWVALIDLAAVLNSKLRKADKTQK